MCLKLQMVEWNPLLYIDIYIYMAVFLFFLVLTPISHTPKVLIIFIRKIPRRNPNGVCWGKPQHFRPEAPPSSTSIWTWPQVSGWGCPGPGVPPWRGPPGSRVPAICSFKLEWFFCWAKIWDPSFLREKFGRILVITCENMIGFYEYSDMTVYCEVFG